MEEQQPELQTASSFISADEIGFVAVLLMLQVELVETRRALKIDISALSRSGQQLMAWVLTSIELALMAGLHSIARTR